MSFLFPAFLFALAVIIIPVLIHLFHFRRYKVVKFPDLRFLKSVFTEQKNRNRLKHLLILTSRILAFICLVLAFAIPGCRNAAQTNPEPHVAVFLDNSNSMGYQDKDGLVFEKAKEAVRNLVSSFSGKAKFRLITHNSGGFNAGYTSAGEFIKQVDGTDLIANSHSFKRIYDELLKSSTVSPDAVFLVSDFQESFLRTLPSKTDRVVNCGAVKITRAGLSNISIDSAWLGNPYALPGDMNRIFFVVKNFSNEGVEAGVRLMLNNQVSAVSTVNVKAGSTGTGSLDFRMDPQHQMEVKLVLDDEGFTFDNELFLALATQSNIKIALRSSNLYVDSAISKVGFLEKVSDENVPSARVWVQGLNGKISAKILQGMKSHLDKGNILVIFPDEGSTADDYRALSNIFGSPLVKSVNNPKTVLRKQDLGNPFFDGVFNSIPQMVEMPGYTQYYSSTGKVGNGEKIMSFENGDPFLLKINSGKGVCFMFLAPLDKKSGTMVQSVLFFPVISNCVIPRNSRSSLYGILNSGEGLPLRKAITTGDGKTIIRYGKEEWIPEIQQSIDGPELYIGSEYKSPGHYSIQNKSSSEITETVALNASRIESNPADVSEKMMTQLSADYNIKWYNSGQMVNNVAKAVDDNSLWRLFIWLAASFFAFEVLLIVFWDKLFQSAQLSTDISKI